eukprot:TRINITY_DN5570_c0_g1_i1.p1 TRINITY_DN5570_c0_g1~~TRINITY_DN5570_c0_g1_i1.p1  ORF type:complete len:264 (+),score=59.20 TRINITY_DN5570_c0_g1_i1:69-794(+)
MANNVEEWIDYSARGKDLNGAFIYPQSASNQKLDTVVIIHAAFGVTDHELNYGRRLANEGYLSFVADVFGKNVRNLASLDAAKEHYMPLMSDRNFFRDLLNAAINLAKQHKNSSGRVVITGFCMGGAAALEAARSGADLAGAASFHGSLNTPDTSHAKNIKCPLIIFHGHDDPFVGPEVSTFQKEMTDAKVDFQFISFSNTVHSFTNINENVPGKAQYSESAARRSWIYFLDFLNEVFAKK